MAKKKLEGEELEKFKKDVLAGVTPYDLKDMYGVAISSVHNYKSILKKQGLDVPNVRGQRPSGKNEEPKTSTHFIKLLHNGTTFLVPRSAQGITITGNSVEILI